MATALTEDCRELLEFQRGVIARWQVAASGPDPAAFNGLLRTGRWQQLYRGVYASFTGDPPRECLFWGAVLRAGSGAVLSNHSAAELDRLTDRPGEAIHVTVDHTRRVRACGPRHPLAPPIILHRSGRIERARHPARVPPRTRIEETVLDLTQLAADPDGVFGWLSVGCGRRLVTPQQLTTALAERKHARWRSEILAAIGVIGDGAHSLLEYRYVRDVEQAHGLPRASRQSRTKRGSRSQYFDNLYQPFGVAVELDGRVAHLIEDRWRDIHRDNCDASNGVITLRYSWTEVTCQPCRVAAEVAAVLRRHGWTGRLTPCTPACSAFRPRSGDTFRR